jgi:hypothetical protein
VEIAESRFDFTDYSFNRVCVATRNHALDLIARTGGQITSEEVVIPHQKPRPLRQEQWLPGVPDRLIGVEEDAWTWGDGWTAKDGARQAVAADCVATLRFQGVAVALTGPMGGDGGRADVLVDDRRVALVLDAWVPERTHDLDLWRRDRLKPGAHRLQLITRPDADPRSTGHLVTIHQAIVYR